MRYWEFLIQQEGDQTWLPLETRQVEILEGRYRMAAHTSYNDTSVEIRVSQLLLDEIPPRRRVRKRKSVTDDSGLLAIFPYMQLSPGHWEIDCNSPDVIDDFLGESWHYSVQLQVTPQDEDDWEPDWSNANPNDDSSQLTEPETVITNSTADPDNHQSTEDANQAAGFQLELKQQAYVTELGKALTLTGNLSQDIKAPLSGKQLWVELRDPQTASILEESLFELTIQSLPSPFSITVNLPKELSTQVILGAVSLRSHSETQVLASASFTVTIGLAQMLNAIANQPNLEFEEEISIFPGSTESFVPPPEKTEALITRDTLIIPRELIPSEGLTLPPQIKPPSASDEDEDRQPELPDFSTNVDRGRSNSPVTETTTHDTKESPIDDLPSESSTEELTPDLLADEPPNDSSDEIPVEQEPAELSTDDLLATTFSASDGDLDSELLDETLDDPIMDELNSSEEMVETNEPLPFAEPKVFELGSIEDDELDLELANAAQDDLEKEPLPSHSFPIDKSSNYSVKDTTPQWDSATDPIDQAFQKLQLRERFWQKLNLFTQEGYRESLEVKQALQTSDVLPEGNQQSNEFVAYEPRPQRLEQQTFEQPLNNATSQPTNDDTEPLQVLPPTLDVPMKELVAGEWIAIKVRLPVANYHPYVKVWMNDLQTRTVIEAPRMLMQFTPNDFNELETLMRVQVPIGCLELQIAAIAVDMSTLQESRKVVQNRRVMPPDNTLSVFDDWDL
ncbi:MAG: hypothetical protein F6K11_00575 [Leptolyngbya sp. SIO3F4]|nr:hypothetical protein [Leptolyngbya sp. SIO3F4]